MEATSRSTGLSAGAWLALLVLVATPSSIAGLIVRYSLLERAEKAPAVFVGRQDSSGVDDAGYFAKIRVLELLKGDVREGIVVRVRLSAELPTAVRHVDPAKYAGTLRNRVAIFCGTPQPNGEFWLEKSAARDEFNEWHGTAVVASPPRSVIAFPVSEEDTLPTRLFAAFLGGLSSQKPHDQGPMMDNTLDFVESLGADSLAPRLIDLSRHGNQDQRLLGLALLMRTRHPERFDVLLNHPEAWPTLPMKFGHISAAMLLRLPAEAPPLSPAEFRGLRRVAEAPGMEKHMVEEAVGAMRTIRDLSAIRDWTPWLSSSNKHFRYHAVAAIAEVIHKGCLVFTGYGDAVWLTGDRPCPGATRFASAATAAHTPSTPAAFFEEEERYLSFWRDWVARNQDLLPAGTPQR